MLIVLSCDLVSSANMAVHQVCSQSDRPAISALDHLPEGGIDEDVVFCSSKIESLEPKESHVCILTAICGAYSAGCRSNTQPTPTSALRTRLRISGRSGVCLRCIRSCSQ